jgi:hypothetical protein
MVGAPLTSENVRTEGTSEPQFRSVSVVVPVGNSPLSRRGPRGVRAAAGLALLLALAAAACGGSASSGSGSASSVTQPLSETLERAGPTPSESARMVCAPEARTEIAAALGRRETRVTTPTWVDHVYSCTYVYPNGKVTLSVKELSSLGETEAYFDRLEQTHGKVQSLYDLGQGGFITPGGDAVVRKDYKVMLVDVHDIPSNFVPAMRRSDVAQNIAVTLMACWTGA